MANISLEFIIISILTLHFLITAHALNARTNDWSNELANGQHAQWLL